MKYFPFDMTRSRKSIIISLIILCVSVLMYIELFQMLRLRGFVILGIIVLFALINFTYNCISIVTVDVDTVVVNTLLIRDKLLYIDEIEGYDYEKGRITLLMEDGRRYRLPAKLTHTKRFLDTLDYIIRSGDDGHKAVS